jgi:hypothetical protein
MLFHQVIQKLKARECTVWGAGPYRMARGSNRKGVVQHVETGAVRFGMWCGDEDDGALLVLSDGEILDENGKTISDAMKAALAAEGGAS